MLTTHKARVALARMEQRLAETRRNIVAVTAHMSRYAEAETLRRRPKQRRYRRSSSRWSGADENEYRCLLDALSRVSDAELERLERKAERQDRAIEAMRCKYRINVPRPFLPHR